jgi:hypothetical protein
MNIQISSSAVLHHEADMGATRLKYDYVAGSWPALRDSRQITKIMITQQAFQARMRSRIWPNPLVSDSYLDISLLPTIRSYTNQIYNNASRTARLAAYSPHYVRNMCTAAV